MRLFAGLLALVIAVAGFVGSSASAAGPIERRAGPYGITFGYTSEPGYMEELTTIRVQVRELATGQPVRGLETTLKIVGTVRVLEITKDFSLYLVPFEDRPGVYEAVFIPPKPGDFSYHVTGVIGSTPIDESYVTGDGGLAPIAVRTEIDYGERGSIIATMILGAYGVGLAILLAFMLRRRLKRPAQPA